MKYYKNSTDGTIYRVIEDRLWVWFERWNRWEYRGAGYWVLAYTDPNNKAWYEISEKEAFIEIL